MTLMTMCALCPALCRLAEAPDIRNAVSALAAQEQPAPRELDRLSALIHSCAAEADVVLTALPVLDHEVLAFFHLCGQCSPEEMLAVLCRCTIAPTAEGLAMLISQQRKQQAMARYGLQLLWRLCGDASLPDAAALFPAEGPARSPDSIVRGLMQQLEGRVGHE